MTASAAELPEGWTMTAPDSDDMEAVQVADRIGRWPTPVELRALDALRARRQQATGQPYATAWKEALAMQYPTADTEPYEQLRDPMTADELREQLLREQRDELAQSTTTNAGQIVTVDACRIDGCTRPKKGGRGRTAPYCPEHGQEQMRLANEQRGRAAIRAEVEHQEQPEPVPARSLEVEADPEPWSLSGFLARCAS